MDIRLLNQWLIRTGRRPWYSTPTIRKEISFMSIQRHREINNHSRQDATRIIARVVRGEKTWLDLQRFGVTFLAEGNTYREENPNHVAAVVRAADVANGLIRHW